MHLNKVGLEDDVLSTSHHVVSISSHRIAFCFVSFILFHPVSFRFKLFINFTYSWLAPHDVQKAFRCVGGHGPYPLEERECNTMIPWCDRSLEGFHLPHDLYLRRSMDKGRSTGRDTLLHDDDSLGSGSAAP